MVLKSAKQSCCYDGKNDKSSRLQIFFKVGVLKIFANFTGKHLCWSLASLLKKTPTQVFSCEIYKNFKNNFFYRTPLVAVIKRSISLRKKGLSATLVKNLTHFFIAPSSFKAVFFKIRPALNLKQESSFCKL